MGESCVVRRAVALRAPSGDGGAFGSYLHNTVAPTLGSKGALVVGRVCCFPTPAQWDTA